jgi:hypothetical protein
MGSSQNHHVAQASILPELLRRTLSLLEFYGQIDGKEQELFEVRLALIRAIDRLAADEAANAAAARGEEPASGTGDGLPHRKQPAGEHIDSIIQKSG